MKKAEPEIRALFDQYNDRLMKEKKAVSDKLTKWGSLHVRRIEEYVAEQKKFLDEHFDKQKRFLETERKRITAEVTTCEKKKETEPIEQLLAYCKNLKVNLPVVVRDEKPISYMRVSTEEALELKESDKNNAQQTKENQTQDKPAEDNNNDSKNGASGSRRPSLRPPSAKQKPPSEESQETGTSIVPNSSLSGDVSSKSDVESGDGMLDKCPVCFMMFSKSMGKEDRNLHVNEHYGDD